MSDRLRNAFFTRDVLKVAPELLGKKLVRQTIDGSKLIHTITETEAYRGEEDLACHASKGKTERTKIMYNAGGCYYVYLIYGMHWMLNIVTGTKENPQAVLIRGINDFNGPGKLSKHLKIDKSLNGVIIENSQSLWVEDQPLVKKYHTGPRIGIDYAGEKWKNMPWRFYVQE